MVWWGRELRLFYNDAWLPVLGRAKHPSALAAPGREVWPEVWHIVGPMLQGVLDSGEPTWSDDQLLPLDRSGYLEEAYFTYSYSPIPDDKGGVGGVFAVVSETTHKVVAERRLRTLEELAASKHDALRASEERYRSVLGLMPAAVYTCEAPSGVITFFNDHAVELWGRAPRIGDVDQRFCGSLKLWRPEGTPLPHHETPMALAVRDGQAFRNEEVVIERPDGSRVTVLVNIDPLRSESGRVIGAINVFHDISERRSQAEKLRESERRLAEEADALTRLHAASSRLWQAKSLSEGLEVILEATIALMGADRGNIQLLDGGVLKIAAHRGFQRAFLDFFREVSAEDDSASGRALRNGERIMIEDVETDAPFAPLRDVARAASFRAVVSSPLIARDNRPLGIISTHWSTPHRPSEFDLRRLDLYTRQAADFIERCHADDRLRENEQQLRLALEAGRMGAWEWSVASNRVTWSPGLEALHGLTPGSFDGTFEGFRRDIHPDDRELVEHNIAHTLETGADHHVEYRITTAHGAVRWLEGRGKLHVDANGHAVRMVGVCADITARKQAEIALLVRARQQEAVASLGELALRERDLQTVFDEATAGVARALDIEYCKVLELLPDGKEVLLRSGVGWKSGLVGHARVSTGIDSQAGYTLATDAPVIVTDLRTETRFHGPSLLTDHDVVSGMSCVIHGPDGDAWGVLGAHSKRRLEFQRDDISFLTSVANVLGHAIQRQRAESALRQSDRSKDEFIAMLSHELRNPLAPLRSGLDLMRLQEPAGSQVKVRAMMERQVGHLVRLVDDLLEASRISRGLLELRREALQLNEVLRNAIEASEPLMRDAGHRLQIELPHEALWLEGDAVRLAQAFANLLNNAARYTPPGGTISLRAEQTTDGQIRVSVRDSGVGFSPAQKEKFFVMFARGSGSSGLGIGLALARQLVEMHGGKIEAHSDGEGHGAEFVVTLPHVTAPQRAEPLLSARSETRCRVLVADDNRDAAESLGALLRALGNDVRIANDGLEAVEAANRFQPNVVLLDIGMPRLDGYGAAREIRQNSHTRAVKIIALTGWGQDEDRRRAYDAGFDAHLVKPAEIDALRRLLAEVTQEGVRLTGD